MCNTSHTWMDGAIIGKLMLACTPCTVVVQVHLQRVRGLRQTSAFCTRLFDLCTMTASWFAGVEAGKKAAAQVLSLQKRVQSVINAARWVFHSLRTQCGDLLMPSSHTCLILLCTFMRCDVQDLMIPCKRFHPFVSSRRRRLLSVVTACLIAAAIFPLKNSPSRRSPSEHKPSTRYA